MDIANEVTSAPIEKSATLANVDPETNLMKQIQQKAGKAKQLYIFDFAGDLWNKISALGVTKFEINY